eukprot:scaffold135386_cov20-Prasinocladus_malaysianus.AAC.1
MILAAVMQSDRDIVWPTFACHIINGKETNGVHESSLTRDGLSRSRKPGSLPRPQLSSSAMCS